jgi:hypothetical protein
MAGVGPAKTIPVNFQMRNNIKGKHIHERQIDKARGGGCIVDEWARRRTPGPRRRGPGGPAQANRENVQGPHYETDAVTQ